MRIFLRFALLLALFVRVLPASAIGLEEKQDTAEVNSLNELAFNSRRINAEQALLYANKALAMAKKLSYDKGIAEAFRMRGLAKIYQNQTDSAIYNYSEAKNFLQKSNDQTGLAKLNNNIGGVYRDIKEYDKALKSYQQSLAQANRMNMKPLIAGLYLNMGIVYQKQGKINQSIECYEKSADLFKKLDLPAGIASVYQSLSSFYKDLGDWEKAEEYAVKAIELAKSGGDNYMIASTNLTLSLIYIATDRYEEADKSITEGVAYAKLLEDSKFLRDFGYRKFQLYQKQKNYEKALNSLFQVYLLDSAYNDKYESDKVKVLQEQTTRVETQAKNQVLLEQERNSRIIFWASVLVMALLAVVVILLVRNVRKKNQTNKQLTQLNQEISMQKENLDRINHNLEEIIDARTHDLKIKNRKLSEYSSHLSHQIRGPVATLKGLMNLNREGLIEKDEVITQMEKCVIDIDDKILRINDMLHDPKQDGFSDASQKEPDAVI